MSDKHSYGDFQLTGKPWTENGLKKNLHAWRSVECTVDGFQLKTNSPIQLDLWTKQKFCYNKSYTFRHITGHPYKNLSRSYLSTYPPTCSCPSIHPSIHVYFYKNILILTRLRLKVVFIVENKDSLCSTQDTECEGTKLLRMAGVLKNGHLVATQLAIFSLLLHGTNERKIADLRFTWRWVWRHSQGPTASDFRVEG